MFTRLLVPLDGTPESNAALPLARTVALATRGSVVLLRVLPERDASDNPARVAEETEALTRTATELAGSGLQVASIVRQGEPADEILKQVQLQRVDLIVMRTHGRVGLERAVIGSVAERVLTHTNVPVMTLRPGGRRVSHIERLVVPVGGSPGGAVALATAVGLAKATDATIHLVQVVVPIPVQAWAAYSGMTYYDPAWDEEALNSAKSYVTGLVGRLRDAGVKASGDAHMVPDVARGIVDVADKLSADLVVMSTHARTGVARAVLGSAADALVRTAHCPVLLIHRPDIASAQQSPPPNA
jgi:nucleotide-binding universal stress UspA family protein